MVNESQSITPPGGATAGATLAPAGAQSDSGWALLHFRGADAAKFLQGQLSNDVQGLEAQQFRLAGLHNPQGRVLALLRLVAPEPDHIVALLPADLAAATQATLSRYVLRAKVALSSESTPAALRELVTRVPALAERLRPGVRALDIAAGLPQVYAATSGEFVAQMLNLDCVGAISFNKGCYTGQEIIARAHYRGRMKRRMQRFVTAGRGALAPGATIALSDGRSAQVVDATTLADGRCEFLAVAPLPGGGGEPLAAADAHGAAERVLDCSALPLPYPLPA